jgi:E3 ubiquitin-protein ligase KEG
MFPTLEYIMILQIGDRVCVKRSVAEPRYAWGGETHHSVGRISEIENDGLLIIEISNRPIPWQADPSDMEKVEDFKVTLNSYCTHDSKISMVDVS